MVFGLIRYCSFEPWDYRACGYCNRCSDPHGDHPTASETRCTGRFDPTKYTDSGDESHNVPAPPPPPPQQQREKDQGEGPGWQDARTDTDTGTAATSKFPDYTEDGFGWTHSQCFWMSSRPHTIMDSTAPHLSPNTIRWGAVE